MGLQRFFLSILLEQIQKKIQSLHRAMCDLYPLITYSIKRVITDWKGYFLPSQGKYNCLLRTFGLN